MENLTEVPPGYVYWGWTATVNGRGVGTCSSRHGPMSFDSFVKEYPNEHVVESLVFAPVFNEGLDDEYLDYGKHIKVQTREHKNKELV